MEAKYKATAHLLRKRSCWFFLLEMYCTFGARLAETHAIRKPPAKTATRRAARGKNLATKKIPLGHETNAGHSLLVLGKLAHAFPVAQTIQKAEI